MKPCLLATLSWCALTAAAAAEDLSGVFVKREATDARVEFSGDGKCYFGGVAGHHSVTAAEENEFIICSSQGREVMRFRSEQGQLIDQEGAVWVPRDELIDMPWQEVQPVTLAVVDVSSREPIEEFRYWYRISNELATFDPLLVRPLQARNENGEIVLDAPVTCEIEILVESDDLLGGYGSWKQLQLTAENEQRRFEVEVRKGVTCEGAVVAADTGRPIVGARVSPIVFSPPLFSPDKDRSIATDANGRFSLRGVEPKLGINVWHDESLEFNPNGLQYYGKMTEPGVISGTIRLNSGERLKGIVRDPQGHPLAEVSVEDGAGKQVFTDENGVFELASPSKWGAETTYSIHFKKEGYLRQGLEPESADPVGFSVVLQPLPTVVGQVLDSQQRPVDDFRVAVGATPEPDDWACTSQDFVNAQGKFSVPVNSDLDYGETGKVWVGIQSDGFAMWESVVDLADLSTLLMVRLSPGHVVRGAVTTVGPEQSEVTAMLLPIRSTKGSYNVETSYRQELGRMKTSVDADGAFQFDHVAPGPYVLSVFGPTLSPASTEIIVADDIDAGQFQLRGRGELRGVVFKDFVPDEADPMSADRPPWPFAEGEIHFRDNSGRADEYAFPHLKPLKFKADAEGRFIVKGVPVGEVTATIPYMVSADIQDAHVRSAIIAEERTTEVRFFDMSARWRVDCQLTVGDGSPQHFLSGSGIGAKRQVDRVTSDPQILDLRVTPKLDDPISSIKLRSFKLSQNQTLNLFDIHPGNYRLQIADSWSARHGGEAFYEMDVVASDQLTTWKIELGAGCITGAIVDAADANRRMVAVVGQLSPTVRYGRADIDGNFCVRYLPKDIYTLWIYDLDGGWLRKEDIVVRDEIKDVGVHTLSTGGTVTGTIPITWQSDDDVRVVAIDERGIEINYYHYRNTLFDNYTLADLWPGKWRVQLKLGDRMLAEQTVNVTTNQTVVCDLVSDAY